ncbi:hypothetical protein E2320_014411 [Naja naja]|nr:hypothetical protein E2320_014411 [Naja naja]
MALDLHNVISSIDTQVLQGNVKKSGEMKLPYLWKSEDLLRENIVWEWKELQRFLRDQEELLLRQLEELEKDIIARRDEHLSRNGRGRASRRQGEKKPLSKSLRRATKGSPKKIHRVLSLSPILQKDRKGAGFDPAGSASQEQEKSKEKGKMEKKKTEKEKEKMEKEKEKMEKEKEMEKSQKEKEVEEKEKSEKEKEKEQTEKMEEKEKEKEKRQTEEEKREKEKEKENNPHPANVEIIKSTLRKDTGLAQRSPQLILNANLKDRGKLDKRPEKRNQFFLLWTVKIPAKEGNQNHVPNAGRNLIRVSSS